MNFKYHFLIGLICSISIFLIFNLNLIQGLIIFLSSWLIDVDHYLWYAFEFKDWNPTQALRWRKESTKKWNKLNSREKKNFKHGIFIFHSVGFWVILFLLGIYSNKIFLFVLIGIGIHIIVDWVDLISRGESIFTKVSLLYVLIKDRNKKNLRKL